MAKGKGSTFERLTRKRLNRKERKQLQRRLFSDHPGLEIVHAHAAGIDIGNASHFVAVPPGRDAEPVREFGCWTEDLEHMAEWLRGCGIDTVAMQSTGVYWFAVYDVLERHGLKVFLVNAAHTRNLPGRKSDVQESQWLMKLHTYGLLRNSFRPPEEVRRLRTLWRLRDQHVKQAGRHIQHMQKALTAMNIQLADTISDLSGASGRAIAGAILKGERNAGKLAALCAPGMRASQEEVARSLEGNWQDDALFALEQAVEAWEFTQQQLRKCDERLQQYLKAMPDRVAPSPDEKPKQESGNCAGPPEKKKRRNRSTRSAPQFDLHSELKRIFGVDLTSIDGVDVMTAQTVLSEVGPDVRAWESEAHFASWLNLTPKRDISGGKVIRQVRERAKNRVATALRMAATTLLRSSSYLGARYRYLRMRLGAGKAIKAMARHLACLIYRLITQGQSWVDRGAREFEEKRTERELEALRHNAARRGYRLVAESPTPS